MTTNGTQQGGNMKLYECEHCEIIFANASGIESNGVCVCGGKTKPRPDLQLVPVDKGCDCDMITRILKKQKAEDK